MYQTIINRIIIHHSWSKDNENLCDWENIKGYHLNLGWDDIGYHYGIEKVDNVYNIMHGRPEYIVGAHCLGYNKSSLGIVVVGNYDLKEPEDAAYELLARLCCSRMHKHKTIAEVSPHHKYNQNKTCPGKLFDMKLLGKMIDYYASHLPVAI